MFTVLQLYSHKVLSMKTNSQSILVRALVNDPNYSFIHFIHSFICSFQSRNFSLTVVLKGKTGITNISGIYFWDNMNQPVLITMQCMLPVCPRHISLSFSIRARGCVSQLQIAVSFLQGTNNNLVSFRQY